MASMDRMSDICLRRWRVTPAELEMEPGLATPAVWCQVQRQCLESLQRRRRLPVVAYDRPCCRRSFFRCVVAEYGNYKETTQGRLTRMSAGEFD